MNAPATADREELCDVFEQAWISGQAPELSEFLAAYAGEDREQLFFDLLELDLDYRRRKNEPRPAESFAAQFPEFRSKIETAFQRLEKLDETKPLAPQGTQPASTATPRKLEKLGPYDLLEELGRGGMGIVFRARQRSLNRLVALKVIRSGELAGAEEVLRFRREAEAAAALEHPAIVPVFEVGEDQGFVYFSMGLVEGGSLADLVAETALPERQAAALVEQIARAVSYAHQQGVIHRDLKPANILLDTQRQPKITDFGLAKRLQDDKDLTATGQILGTPSYMPPEQARGDQASIGPASDVYSLGAILYRLLAGRSPFQAATLMDTLHDVVHSEPVPPRQLVPGLTADLETICLKCLEKSPDNRYATAEALADDLRRWLQGEPILARPSTASEKLFKWARRNPVVSGLSAALAIALLLGTIFSTVFGVNANLVSKKERAARITAQAATRQANDANQALKKEKAEVIRQKDEVTKQKDEVTRQKNEVTLQKEEVQKRNVAIEKQNTEIEKQKNEIERQLKQADATIYSITISRAHQELAAGNVGEAQRLLNSTVADHRDWEFGFLQSRGKRLTQELRPALITTSILDISPDENWLAVGHVKDKIRVVNIQKDVTMAEFGEPTDEVLELHFSPDVRHLIARNSASVTVWDWPKSEKVQEFKHWNDGGVPWQMALSQDGKSLALGYQGHIYVHQPLTGELIKHFTFDRLEIVEGLDISADGKQIVSLHRSVPKSKTVEDNYDYTLVSWSLEQEEPTHCHSIPSFEHGGTREIHLHPDGQHVLCGKDAVQIWDRVTGKRVRSFRSQEWTTNAAKYGAGGQRVWSIEGYSEGKSPRIVRVWDPDAQRPLLSISIGATNRVAVSPSGGKMVVAIGRSYQVYDLRLTPDRETFTGDWVTGLAWYPGSERLVAIGAGHAQAWDARSKQTTLLFNVPNTGIGSFELKLSPDGKRLVTARPTDSHEPGSMGVRLWDAASGDFLFELDHSSYCAEFHPKKNQLVTSSLADDQTVIWDLEKREPARKFPLALQSCAISHDGRWLVGSGYKPANLNIWDLDAETDQPAAILEGTTATGIAFSLDNRRLILGHGDSSISVWDLQQKKRLMTMQGHTIPVRGIALSPNGKRLASIAGGRPKENPNREGEVKIWDLENGVELLSLAEPGWWPRAVAFSPDGKRLAVGGQSGKVHVWTSP